MATRLTIQPVSAATLVSDINSRLIEINRELNNSMPKGILPSPAIIPNVNDGPQQLTNIDMNGFDIANVNTLTVTNLIQSVGGNLIDISAIAAAASASEAAAALSVLAAELAVVAAGLAASNAAASELAAQQALADMITALASIGTPLVAADIGNTVAGLTAGKVPNINLPATALTLDILASEKGAANGVATLVAGKVPAAQLPAATIIPTLGIIGEVVAIAGNAVPVGTLECNGALLSRATYAALFSVIGTLHGVGDGVTTFQLPDLRNRFVRGKPSWRNVGNYQSDAYLEHRHVYQNSTVTRRVQTTATGGALVIQDGAINLFTSLQGAGTETRPKNIALRLCIVY